jgi:hypothetical protein
MVANTIHAVAESTPSRLPSESIAVALQARDEAHLRELSALLGVRGIPHHMVVETEGEHALQAMAIGIEPTRDRALVRKAVSGLPLVR